MTHSDVVLYQICKIVFQVCRHYRWLWRCCEVAEWRQIAEHSTKLQISATADKYYSAQEMLAILYQLMVMTSLYFIFFTSWIWPDRRNSRGRATSTPPSSWPLHQTAFYIVSCDQTLSLLPLLCNALHGVCVCTIAEAEDRVWPRETTFYSTPWQNDKYYSAQ